MKTIFSFLLISFSVLVRAQEWKPMFTGQDLSGWTVRGGEATFTTDGNLVVGTSKGSENTFLITTESFDDFILELELYVDSSLNSGIQIRSHIESRVYGYQVEVDPGVRAWSGGLYDEGRRGWLYPLSLNPKARSAFKNGIWNKYRIEAIGHSIRVWVNGICTSSTLDDEDDAGYIGLQVHGVGSPDQDKQIKWRNVRILTEHPERYATPIPNEMYELNLLGNVLTEREKNQGWKLLWDGKTTTGWRQVHAKDFPAKKWKIKEGVLTVQASSGKGSGNGQDIITRDSFENFELTLQYKITKGANSGIKYFVNESFNPEGGAIGLEFQILDNKNHPDAAAGMNGNHKQGALYDLIPATNLSWPPAGEQYNKDIGQWNHVRIISNHGRVEHWLNGFKVTEYDRLSDSFRALVAKSKYRDWPDFGQYRTGHLALQDHGDKVSFRSIKIKVW